jgi:hemerythrin-like domain-containing protein
MKRSAALVQLSRDHHVALAVALRLRRATPGDLADAISAFADFWTPRGRDHFDREETVLAPVLPANDPECQAAVERMLAEHAEIRSRADRLADSLEAAHDLGERLHDHVRFEERTLFALVEDRLDDDELARLGAALAA